MTFDRSLTFALGGLLALVGVAGAAKSGGGADVLMGRYQATPPTLTDGAMMDLLLDSRAGLVLGAGTASIGSVQVINAAGNPVNARLGDGTDQTLVTAVGELNVLATAQPGVDVGDVTVNNAAGAAAVNVQDGGNTITVDGSAGAAFTQGAGAQDANTIRITQASNDAGVTSLGTLDNLVFAEDAAHVSTDSGVMMLAVATDAAPAIVGAAGDYAPPAITLLNAYRVVQQPERYVDSLGAVYLVATAFTTITTVGAEEISCVAAQGAGNSIVLLGYQISSSASQVTMQFESDDADAGITIQAQNTTSFTTDNEFRFYGETADNQALKLQVSTAATVSVQVWYLVR